MFSKIFVSFFVALALCGPAQGDDFRPKARIAVEAISNWQELKSIENPGVAILIKLEEEKALDALTESYEKRALATSAAELQQLIKEERSILENYQNERERLLSIWRRTGGAKSEMKTVLELNKAADEIAVELRRFEELYLAEGVEADRSQLKNVEALVSLAYLMAHAVIPAKKGFFEANHKWVTGVSVAGITSALGAVVGYVMTSDWNAAAAGAAFGGLAGVVTGSVAALVSEGVYERMKITPSKRQAIERMLAAFGDRLRLNGINLPEGPLDFSLLLAQPGCAALLTEGDAVKLLSAP